MTALLMRKVATIMTPLLWKLRLGALCLVMLACLNMIRVCISILMEHYGCLNRSKGKKRDCDEKQRPSESDNSPRGNLAKLQGKRQNTQPHVRNSLLKICPSKFFVGFLDFFTKCSNLCVKFFGGLHKP